MGNELQAKKKSRNVAPLIEFTGAAHEYSEPGFDTGSIAVQASQTRLLGPYEIPAEGYLRHLNLVVEASGGALGTGVTHEDFPFRLIEEIVFIDVGGGEIVSPFSGYELFLANLYGGYAFQQDPRLIPDYSSASPNATFLIRVPVEVHHNTGFGAVANQSSSTTYKVRITLAALNGILTTVGTATPPNVRIRGYVEDWTQPAAVDPANRPQAYEPPRHGTSQYWKKETKSLSSGNQKPRLTNVGNLMRGVILIWRTPSGSAGVRTNATFPEEIKMKLDNRELLTEHRFMRRAYMMERYIHAAAGVPAGVYAYTFDHDTLGHGGDGTPELWIPTVGSTRWEFEGNWTAAGDLTILTNEVAPIEVDEMERLTDASETMQPATA